MKLSLSHLYCAAQAEARAWVDSGRSRSSVLQILVVDDDDGCRSALVRMLELLGHRAVGAAGGREGLRLWRESRPDVVILDILMPELDGLEVLGRTRGEWSRARVIAMSGDDLLADSVLRCAELLGADATLFKPFDAQTLVNALAPAGPARARTEPRPRTHGYERGNS